MYRWSELVVQPLSSNSAMANWPETRTISGVSPTQIGYRPWSQLKSSAFCTPGIARVRDWYMWWCVLIRPGTTTWWRASMTSSTCVSSSSVFSAAGMRRSMRPSNQQRSILQFGLGIVLRGDATGAVDEQSGHGLVLARCETSRGRIPWPPGLKGRASTTLPRVPGCAELRF